MKVDFVATLPHCLDHLAPVWLALTPDERGHFMVAKGLEPLADWYGIPHGDGPYGDVLVAASHRDTRGGLGGRKLVLMEHGVGQSYADAAWPEYVGGRGREYVSLFLSPNQRAFDLNAAANPQAEHAVIGMPFMDRHFRSSHPPSGAVAVTWHWRGGERVPEMDTAFNHFRSAVANLSLRTALIGHAHPRIANELEPWYRRHGIFWASHLDSVLREASCLMADNTSALFCFAALDRPVVVMNSPSYRKTVNHGLRFWEYADVGVQVDDPDLLQASVEIALADEPARADRRREITEALFPYRDGSCAARAAYAIRALA